MAERAARLHEEAAQAVAGSAHLPERQEALESSLRPEGMRATEENAEKEKAAARPGGGRAAGAAGAARGPRWAPGMPALLLPPMFASHMRPQQGAATRLWGLCAPGLGPVGVQYEGEEVAAAEVDAVSGRWEARLPPREATLQPAVIRVYAGNAT
ncbi:unnamed protein product [Prorocentrum cordatum]|uniref:Uncharacterized protein n=1 Tax=Prorocentrum cordatum TaxID=2364126 RepID=A0ABN9QYE5_9DINO|nr:unnamed protein product [Polarella glacialis]